MQLLQVATSKDPDHVTACPFVLPETPAPEPPARLQPAEDPADSAGSADAADSAAEPPVDKVAEPPVEDRA